MTHCKSKKFFLMLKNDLRWGILEQWKKFLLFIGFSIGACMFLTSRIHGINQYQHMELRGTTGDYLLHIFQGMEKYEPSAERIFIIPIVYMGIFILISLIVGNYTLKDLNHRGIQIMTRCQSKSLWMLSKIIWNLLAVSLCYLILIISAVVFGGGSMDFTYGVCERGLHFANVNQAGINQGNMILLMIGMSFLVSVTFAQLQMTFSLIFSPVAAYLFIIVLTFLSAYITKPFLLGNYWMLQRNSLFLENGMNAVTGLIICAGVLVCSITIDFIVIREKSIL